MSKMYRGRLVSKNQMTIPLPMQRELGMVQGDELEFVIERGRISSVHVLAPVRVDLLPDAILESLKQRKRDRGAEGALSEADVKKLSEMSHEEVEPSKPAVGTPPRVAEEPYDLPAEAGVGRRHKIFR